MPPIDREMGNWLHSCHPNSHFRNKLMVARATEHGRLTLGKPRPHVAAGPSSTETRILTTHDELSEVLWQDFGIDSPKNKDSHVPDWPGSNKFRRSRPDLGAGDHAARPRPYRLRI